MDNELLVQNIIKHCEEAKVAPTVACKESGAGKDLIGNIRKGQTPSIAKIADLAAYLGVSLSDLVGDAAPSHVSPEEREFLDLVRRMDAGQKAAMLRFMQTITPAQDAESCAGEQITR